ncbi:hypothetical protein ACIRBX_26225 [Kitasatospora sp. NPDC096147]|uniref:hypothetical protein n=1 Tax=Kitasatospora sp. NPDC096147 TaxID=3364093 RepID=UPI00381C5CD2
MSGAPSTAPTAGTTVRTTTATTLAPDVATDVAPDVRPTAALPARTRAQDPLPTGLRVLATASWPPPEGPAQPPPLPGFSASSFNPLVAAVADLCLDRHQTPDLTGSAPGTDGQDDGDGGPVPPGTVRRAPISGQDGTGGDQASPPPPTPDRTGLVLASTSGDRATARAIDTAAASGRRVPPLLFFQSNPNAVLGHVAARWGLTGPVVAISPPKATAPGQVHQDALELAALLLADGDADRILVITAEQADAPEQADPADAPGPAEQTGGPDRTDHATAVLVTRLRTD